MYQSSIVTQRGSHHRDT